MQFNTLHLPGTSDGSEVPAPHFIHTEGGQPSMGNTSVPWKAFPILISSDFSLLCLCSHNISEELPNLWQGISSKMPSQRLEAELYFLEICTKHFLGRGTTLIQAVTVHCTWNGRLDDCPISVKVSRKSRQLKVYHKYDLSCWSSLVPRSFSRNIYTEFNSYQDGDHISVYNCLSVCKYFNRKLNRRLFRTASGCSVLTNKPNFSSNQKQSHMDLQATKTGKMQAWSNIFDSSTMNSYFLKVI